MRIVTAQELENWLEHGKVIEKDPRGAKVVILENGLFLKIFHTRRHPILARLQPAAQRFQHNAERLNQLGIATPKVLEVFWLDPKAGITGCLYEPLPGQSFEQLFLDHPEQADQALASLAAFIRKLHANGVYFRSLHLGNILLLPNMSYGLIDILDLRFKWGALNRWQTQRNFRHLETYLKRKPLPTFPYLKLRELYTRT